MGRGHVSDLAWTLEGAWWETGTIKCGVLRVIHLVSGLHLYVRMRMVAEDVISSGVIGYKKITPGFDIGTCLFRSPK